MRKDPARFAGGLAEEAATDLAFLLDERRSLARDAHSSALADDVPSSAAEQGLDGLHWSLVDYAALTLGDVRSGPIADC